MNYTYDEGWTSVSEFSVGACQVYILADNILRLLVVSLAALCLLIEVICLIIKWPIVKEKHGVSLILLIWTLLQNIAMALRPLIGFLMGWRSSTYWLMGLITHISTASAAGIAIAFIYLETRLLHRSAMKKDSFILNHGKALFVTIGVLECILFLLGPLITHYTILIKPYQAFWAVVVLIDVTAIPPFIISGIQVYRVINKQDRFKKLARKILIVVGICGAMGTFTGVVGIAACVGIEKIEWILVELCWISDIVFNIAIFFILLQRRKKGVVVHLDKSVGLTTPKSKNFEISNVSSEALTDTPSGRSSRVPMLNIPNK